MFTDTFFNKNNEFQYFIYIDPKFVLVVDFRSDSDTHTTARHKGPTEKKIVILCHMIRKFCVIPLICDLSNLGVGQQLIIMPGTH